jgi:hypothetical protein
VVVLSKRLFNDDGSFGGIVVMALDLAYFRELFEGLSLGPMASSRCIPMMAWPICGALQGGHHRPRSLRQRQLPAHPERLAARGRQLLRARQQ